jgi:hypothetical protein
MSCMGLWVPVTADNAREHPPWAGDGEGL